MAEEKTSFSELVLSRPESSPDSSDRKIRALASRIDEIEDKPEKKAVPVSAGGVTWIKPVSIWTVSVSSGSTAGSFSDYETIDFSREIGGANMVYIELKMTNTRGADNDEVFLALDWRLSVAHDPIHVAEWTAEVAFAEQRAVTSYSTHQLPVQAGKAEIRYKQPSDVFDYEIRVYGYQ